MDYKNCLALLAAIALSACGGNSESGGNEEENQRLTFSDFANEVSESGGTAGPCVHDYYDAVVNIDRVISTPANTEIAGISLIEVVHDDLEVQLETWCDGQTENLCYGLLFDSETPVCSLPCGFGTEEGEWRIELSAEGYAPATVVLDASYGEHEGGCPSYSDHGSHFELELNES